MLMKTAHYCALCSPVNSEQSPTLAMNVTICTEGTRKCQTQISETVTNQEIWVLSIALYQQVKRYCTKIRSRWEIVWSRVSPYCYWPVWSTGTCTCIIISRQQTEVRPKSVIAHNSDPSSFTSPLPHPVIKLNTTIHCAHQNTLCAPEHLSRTKAPCVHQSTLHAPIHQHWYSLFFFR